MSRTINLTELREGGPQDLPAVARIMQDAFDPRYGEAWTSAQCMGMLSLPGVWLTIASIDDADIGFALARVAGPEAELLLLATRPAARGRGVGGALLRAVIAESACRGVIDLHLEVRAGNEAVHLYRREGFEKVGERHHYYRGASGQLFDALTFSRKLR
ncbi:GNAT family N-acetyltransferase [Sphingomonas sp. AOB5]|uniref:GNAT family N-acetyltransferase n=1 Tax=Sphingomonas sp. AOB5 TaxID=3034017 RepID=UPI0023FA41CC|nr:GNAT family N-acetyltransferase [Sphingomonas sp. AOB5]MDF7773791.1 GNAT family N-acetyltransferase [Sphingomonas sp. AOB5]